MFLPDREHLKVFLHRAPVDIRKQRNGLAAVAREVIQQDPFTSGALFVFIGRGRDKLKILYWDKNGFAVWYKVIEGKEKFHWPRRLDAAPAFPVPRLLTITTDATLTKYVQELRLASNDSAALRWLGGIYFTNEDMEVIQPLRGVDATSGVVPELDPSLQFSLFTHYDEIAGFGNLTYDITSRLQATGGVRYSYNSQNYAQFNSGSSLNGLNTLLGVNFPAASPRATSSDSSITYLADIKYALGDDAMVYARFATGYRPGGPMSSSPARPPRSTPIPCVTMTWARNSPCGAGAARLTCPFIGSIGSTFRYR